MFGEALFDLGNQVLFGLAVDIGDEIDIAFVFDIKRFAITGAGLEAAAKNLSGLASQSLKV